MVKNKKLFLSIIILFFLGLFCSKGLLTYYAHSTHDGKHHIARSFDAITSLKEGHFPLRWAGSLNHFCGVPIFNFFYPLLYYLVFLINLAVGDVIFSLNIVSVLTLVLSPIFFYLWIFKETKEHLSSLTAAILYLFVPYRFVLVFVRSSPEFMSYLILPLLLLAISHLFERNFQKNLITKGFLVGLIGGLLVISHNFAAMFLMPIVCLFILFKIVAKKIFQKKNLAFLVFIIVSFFGFSFFFLGPSLLEMNNVQLSTVQTVNYQEHFPTISQLIKSPWGYFYSSPGVINDGMSFMLGYAQWAILAFSGGYFLKKVLQKQKKWSENDWPILFWLSLSLITIFLILPYSMFIWEKTILLPRIQFSWRLLGVTGFTIAALAGYLLKSFKKSLLLYLLVAFIISLALFGNRNHLLPQPVMDIDLYYNFEKENPHRFSTTTFADDILNVESKEACLADEPLIVKMNQSEVLTYEVVRGNTFGQIAFTNSQEERATLKLNLEFFPGAYQIKMNDALVNDYFNCSGRVCLRNVFLKEGENSLEWQIIQTPIQKIANGITVGFIAIWLGFIFVFRKKNV